MPSRQVLATAAKQPANGPPLDSGLFETNWLMNQCPPLAESNTQEGSPPLLHCRFPSPITRSSEMTGETRCRALLKIRISPMLLVSTTDPLPAHSPWSGGSTSLNLLVVLSALSTALMPFTPTAPPANGLMLSQPARSGWQLTVGIWTVGALASPGTWGRSNGRALARSSDFDCPLRAWLADRCATDGVRNGPVSR